MRVQDLQNVCQINQQTTGLNTIKVPKHLTDLYKYSEGLLNEDQRVAFQQLLIITRVYLRNQKATWVLPV